MLPRSRWGCDMALIENDLPAFSNCGRAAEPSPVTEPVIVNSVFITGGAIEVTDSCVRIVGWEQQPAMSGEMVERRIVARLAMSNGVAREIVAALRRGLAKDGH